MRVKPILSSFCCGAICFMPVMMRAAAVDDQKFVEAAAQTDMLEAHLGQMAENQAASQAVKDYAQMLVTDHTNDYKQLSTIATKAGDSVPKGLDPTRDKMIKPFEKLKGAAFDRQFTREMITGHTKAIAEYKQEASNGQSADLKAYASQALPTLEKHLHEAENLRKSKK